MRNFLRAAVLACATATLLAGCGPQLAKIESFVSTVTTTIANPVSTVDIYRVENVYAAALQAVVDYRSYCYARPYAVLMADPIARPVCKYRRRVVRAAQAAEPKATSAVRSAENFVKNNPTVDASSVISAAYKAVTDFQNAVPAVPH